MKEESLAMELVTDFKRQNKRLFVMWLVTFIALVSLVGYIVYLLNDIDTIESTTNQEINRVSTINGNVTNRGR